MGSKIIVEVIEQLKNKYRVKELCFILGVTKSTYYRWKKRNTTLDEVEQAVINLCKAHKYRLGYRKVRNRVSKILKRQINHKRILRLMRLHQLLCRPKRKKKVFLTGQDPIVAPNRIERDFKATRPNEKWFTDITYLNFGEETLYFSSILDMYNGEIISYKMSTRQDITLVLDTLEEACRERRVNNTVLHSDQGGVYTSKRFQQYVKEKGIIMSMSRRGNCHDNAAIESFHSVLKSEAFYAENIKNIPNSIVQQIVEEYICYYNNDRFQIKLNYLSPVEYWQQAG